MPLCAWYMLLVLGISFAVIIYAASTPRPLRLGFSMPRARTRPRSHAWPNLPLQASWPGPPSPRPAPAPHSASTEPRERPLRLPRSVLSLNHAGSPIEAPGRPCCPLPLTDRATRPSSPPRASLAAAPKPQALGRAREPAAPALTHHACHSPAPSRSHPPHSHGTACKRASSHLGALAQGLARGPHEPQASAAAVQGHEALQGPARAAARRGASRTTTSPTARPLQIQRPTDQPPRCALQAPEPHRTSPSRARAAPGHPPAGSDRAAPAGPSRAGHEPP